MKNSQLGVMSTYGAHDRICDGMVAAKTNQWMAILHHPAYVLLNEKSTDPAALSNRISP